jgi:segregation and condensation protein B
MKNLESALTSLLFAVAKPLSYKDLVKFLDIKEEDLKKAIKNLQEQFNQENSGLQIAVNNGKVQMISNPDNGKVLQEYFKEEISSELTKPSLESLTIIAYRQPISKEELEQIRGVNCSLIIRNLLIRGFIEIDNNKENIVPTYSVTMDFLRHLGINSVEELPDFVKLNSDENLNKLLEDTGEERE